MKNAFAWLMILFLSVAALLGATYQKVIRSNVSLVDIYFNALDKKDRPITGLKKDDFQVFENGIEQEIEFFSETQKREDAILTIALIIDTSGSVKDKLRFEIDTAAEFFREILRPKKDLALVVQFDSEVNLVQDFTQDQDDLIRALDSLRAGGNTSLYDAIYLIAEEKLRYEAGRKVMVVISDGEDTSSLVSREEAIEAAQTSDTLIYGLGVRGAGSIGNFSALENFCERTGGAFFSPRAEFKKLQEAFQSIGRELRGQYSLAYSPKDRRKNGTFRAVEIRCREKGVKIRARRGYYAPTGD
ncbi:MAG: VWA domain-containing protein [Acidobacteriota bacterium]